MTAHDETLTMEYENSPETKAVSKARLPGIDLVRISLTWLILLYHTRCAYSATNNWVISNKLHPESEVVKTIVDAWIGFMDIWQIPIFFFLSGLFAFHALSRRSAIRGGRYYGKKLSVADLSAFLQLTGKLLVSKKEI